MKENKIEARRLIGEILLSQHVENDTLVVDDARLRAVVAGTTKFSAEERQRILKSPLTMKRLRYLDLCKQADKKSAAKAHTTPANDLPNQAHIQAANDHDIDVLVLRAAASNNEGFEITANNGHYSIHFLPPVRGQYRLVMSCTPEWTESLHATDSMVQVNTVHGQAIFNGVPDEFGEINAVWPLDISPREYFSQEGHSLLVRKIKR